MPDPQPTKRPRGRPRAYDPDKALQAALMVFWERGYAATALDALSAATGMNRPSLYAAFGNKKAIYRKSLAWFAERLRAEIGTALRYAPDLTTSLRRYYATMLDAYMPDERGSGGCPAICTLLAEAPHDEEMREHLKDYLDEIDRSLTGLFTRAQISGEVAPDADAEALGRLAAAVHHSLAIRARAGEPRKRLEQLVALAVAGFAPAAPGVAPGAAKPDDAAL